MWIKCLLILSISLPAWGYKLTADFTNGFYWATLPIGITVVDSDGTRRATIENVARSAIGEWEGLTGLNLWDTNNSGTQNIIRWSENFAAETRMDPNSVLAVAIRYTNGPYFARTEIVVNGSHFLNRNLNHLLTTLTHELGHTMGLDHSENFAAVMAPTLQDPYNGLHGDDLQGMTHAHNETEQRQLTGYVSPLAYSESKSSEPLSCGTIAPTAAQSGGAMASLTLGMLISFVRKLIKWVKSLF